MTADEIESAASADTPPAPSAERILDAEVIESLLGLQRVKERPSVTAQLESLVMRLRRDAAALKRLEDSRAKMEGAEATVDPSSPAAATDAAPAVTQAQVYVPPPPEQPRPIGVASGLAVPSQHFISIDKYAFDAGSYGSSTVSIYVNLPNVGSISKENIICDFTPTSFDLVVRNLNGKSYRLVNDNLENDIMPDKSKYIVKADKIVIKLGKKKTDYGSYDHWAQLTAKKDKKKKAAEKDNPAAGIMDLMKQMYDDGDENTKKMIGETMLKQREGKLGDGMGGMGDMGMGDMGF